MAIRIFSILLSNAIAVYGVFYLNWNFFMILYSYWFGEIISSVFEKFGYLTIKKRSELPPTEFNDNASGRFFMLGIYWVFIIVIAGFVTAPREQFIENIQVLIFSNVSFNINILFIFLGELAIYLNMFHLNKYYDPKEIVRKNKSLNKRTLVMHISIIFGTFSWFALNTDKFFFHIDMGTYGEYGFMMAFVIIRVIGDIVELRSSSKKDVSLNS